MAKPSPQWIQEEFTRCKSSFPYFVEHYCYVNTGAGFQLMNLAAKQKKLCDKLIEDNNVLILGSRQTGKTTIMVCYCAWVMLFFPGMDITFISRKEAQAKEQMVDLEILFERLPDFLRPTLKPNAATEKKVLETGSKIKIESVLTNPEGKGRGMRSHIVWIDEAAFLKTLSPLLSGLLPTTAQRFQMAKKHNLPHGIVMTTTPNGTKGVGKVFYDYWEAAEESRVKFEDDGERNREILQNCFFTSYRVHWSEMPFYDEKWYEGEKKKFGKRLREFHQEYDLSFLGGEDTFLPDSVIEALTSKPPIKKEGALWIWKTADLSHVTGGKVKEYLIAVDVATMYGHCKSAIQVLDMDTLEQVAEFSDKLPIGPPIPYNLTDEISKLVMLYPNCTVTYENNGVGNQLVEQLPFHPVIGPKLYKEDEKKKKTGFHTSEKSKEDIFNQVYSLLLNRADTINSSRLIGELVGLINSKTGKVTKTSTATDDLVLALGQGYVVFSRLYSNPVTAINSHPETEQNLKHVLLMNVKETDNPYTQASQELSKEQMIEIINRLKSQSKGGK